MNKRFVTGYSIVAFFVLLFSVVLFAVSIYSQLQKGSGEADLGFSWITRSASLSAVTDGFMSDQFVSKLTDNCRKSRTMVAFMITAPSGVVYAWPDKSSQLSYNASGEAELTGSSLFMRTFSTELDIPGSSAPPVIATAVMYILQPSSIFSASRLSFLITLALIFITLIVIIAYTPQQEPETVYQFDESELSAETPPADDSVTPVEIPPFNDTPEDIQDDYSFPFDDFEDTFLPDQDYSDEETLSETPEVSEVSGEADDYFDVTEMEADPFTEESEQAAADLPDFDSIYTGETEQADKTAGEDDAKPEGLYSPTTGVGWEQYLSERLDSELVRAASSEQDLSLMIVRVSGTKHTDLVSRKIGKEFLELAKFRDMVFEFGMDGFAGIFQNITLDQAMKLADELYERIDTLLTEADCESQITIGITTRTARIIPAQRMIEEAVGAAAKAVAEPDLPIVAFRANPDKYRDYIAGNL